MEGNRRTDVESLYTLIQQGLEAHELQLSPTEADEIRQSVLDLEPSLAKASQISHFDTAGDTNWLAQALKGQYPQPNTEIMKRMLQFNTLMETCLAIWDSSAHDQDWDHYFSAIDSIYAHLKTADLAETAEPSSTGMNRTVTKGMHKAAMMKFKRDLYRNGYMVKLDNTTIDSYDFKEAAYNLGHNAMLVGSGSILISALIQLSLNAFRHNAIDKHVILTRALQRGSDNSICLVVTGALRFAIKKGLIPMLSQRTPIVVTAAMAAMGVAISKLLISYANGELTSTEVLDQAGKIVSSLTYQLGFASQGALLGSMALAAIPVVGSLVGSILGGMAGNIIGQKMAQKHYIKTQQLVKVAQFHLDIRQKITTPVYRMNHILATMKY